MTNTHEVRKDMINGVKILVVTTGKRYENIPKCLEKLSKKIKGQVYLMYVKNIEPYPVEVLIELLKQYDKIKKDGQRILEDLAKKIKKLGFNVNILGIHCGIAFERILKIEKQLSPDIILVEYESSRLKRMFLEDETLDLVVAKLNTPILIAR